MIKGIYRIIDRVSGEVYIGASGDIQRRWYEHTYNLTRGEHVNPGLQDAWRRDGPESFAFEILVENDGTELYSLERQYILQCFDDIGEKCLNIIVPDSTQGDEKLTLGGAFLRYGIAIATLRHWILKGELAHDVDSRRRIVINVADLEHKIQEDKERTRSRFQWRLDKGELRRDYDDKRRVVVDVVELEKKVAEWRRK